MSITIKLSRVDNRLLHATVALNWNQFINANYVIVVDPDYIDDPFIASVMQLSLPKTMKVKIFNVEQALHFLQEDTGAARKVMVIFKDLKTARQAVEKGFRTKELQLPYPASRIVIKNLMDYFSKEEIADIRFIQSNGIRLFFQTAPMDNKEYAIFTKPDRNG